jgi:hypothetical protein
MCEEHAPPSILAPNQPAREMHVLTLLVSIQLVSVDFDSFNKLFLDPK